MPDVTLQPPDVLLLADWRARALVRAQLVEEGYEVIAIDAWPIPRLYRVPGVLPRLLLIDLQGLPGVRTILSEIPSVIPPDRVLTVTALGTMPVGDIRRLGFRVIERPVSVGQIIKAVTAVLGRPNNSREGAAYISCG